MFASANALQPDDQEIVAIDKHSMKSRSKALRNKLKRSVALIALATTGGSSGDRQ
jgi:hypothetical protein